MRYSFCIALMGLMLWGCGSPKRTSQSKPLVNPNASAVLNNTAAVKKDTVAVIQRDTVQPSITINQDTIEYQIGARELSPEEKIIEQKKLGINKQANWASAIHYDLRKPNYVIIHHTSQSSLAQTIRTFQVPHSKVSSHYVIGRDGILVQMLNDYERGWHAGKSKWGTNTDINSSSIGIELDNNGREPFPEAQIQSLLVLLDTLKSKYTIPQLNFIGHADIAPMRKDDPNVFFPWKVLAQRGFGIWYNEDYLMDPPENFNPIDALKIMGYDMSNPEGAIRAFKRKYIVKEVNGTLTYFDKKVLYDLYRKYY